MAKVKVFSRLPNDLKFTFQTYVGEGAGMMVTPEDDGKTVILSGTETVVNHTLLVRDGAVTIFGGNKHDLKERVYTLEDLERLKADPVFQKLLKDGSVSLDCRDDLSRDMNGVGKLSAKELEERMAKAKGDDGAIKLAQDE